MLNAGLAPAQMASWDRLETFDLALSPLVLSPGEEREGLWRERGLAFIDLPLGIRARFDASYSRHLYSSDVLSQSFVADFGPEIVGDRTLESRISLTRALARGIELEIAWETRNSLAVNDPMGFGRQTVGARIRISPEPARGRLETSPRRLNPSAATSLGPRMPADSLASSLRESYLGS